MKLIKRILKDIPLFCILGFSYLLCELIWRGRTHISMFFVGGLCGVLIGLLNERPYVKVRSMFQQCCIGTVIVLAIEFFSGIILNKIMNLNVWDYSHTWGNVYGQICLPYAIVWFLLIPFAIYVDDYSRYVLYQEEKPEGILYNYKCLLNNNF